MKAGQAWAVIVLGAVLVDVYFYATGQPTLSAWVWEALVTRPYIAFGAGFVCGHLFWPPERFLQQAKGRSLALMLVLFAASCAHALDSPGPERSLMVRAHLDAFPQIGIAGVMVTLRAWLDDPGAVVRCPTITWIWPNETRSSHTEDCDPEERRTRHSEVKRGRLPSGEHLFRVAFSSEGHEWRAERLVRIK